MSKGKKEKSKQSQEIESVFKEWIYFHEKEITVRQIYTKLLEEQSFELDIWEEAEVLEIGLEGGKGIDMERTEIEPEDEETLAFAKKHGVNSVFFVTVSTDNRELAESCMKTIVKKAGGFFCLNTEGFTPMIK